MNKYLQKALDNAFKELSTASELAPDQTDEQLGFAEGIRVVQEMVGQLCHGVNPLEDRHG